MFKKNGQTLIKHMKSNIFEEIILNNFWFEILLAMTSILNLLFTLLLDKLSFYKASTRLFLLLYYLKALGSIFYIFIHKEKKKLNLLNKSYKLNVNY